MVLHAGHLGRQDAGGAVEGGEGLVKLGHVPADGGLTLDQKDLLPGVRDGQRRVDARNPATDDHHLVAQTKFFTPDSSWSWYPIEFDGHDLFFGLVVGLDVEMGYFSLSELRSICGSWGLAIERDLWFEPTPLPQVPECPSWIGAE